MPTTPTSHVPLIITAPSARNGVTLVQRLLNSSRQIIVYGENRHLCEIAVETALIATETHQQSHAAFDRTRRRFFDETTEFWSSGLWPDSEMYARTAVAGYQALLDAYSRSSAKDGYSRWGIKHPFSEIAAVARFVALVPQHQMIYIYRNPFDVMRSYKSRRFVRTLEDVHKTAVMWTESVSVLTRESDPRLLTIRYEDLIADPDVWISRIEEFTGVENIDRSVMTRKFNTFRGAEERGHARNEYIAPTELTDDEMQIIAKQAGPMLDSLGYAPACAK